MKVLISRMKNIINQIRYYRKKYGIRKTIKKILSKTYSKIFRREEIAKAQSEREKYQIWIQNNEPNAEQLEEQRETTSKLPLEVILPPAMSKRISSMLKIKPVGFEKSALRL